MRIVSTGLTFAALVALAACAGNTSRPTDVGSMALPSTGNSGVRASEPLGRDVGSMSAPSGSGGVVTRTTPAYGAPDTGNMALPPAAQGNSLPRSY